jgi:MFS family permease
MIMAPLTVSLFAEHGWRTVYLGFGITILAIAPLLAFAIVGRPEDRGLHPDGLAAPPNAAGRPSPHAAGDARAALREPNLWLIAFITGVGFMLSSVVVTHLVAMATDSGIEPLRASRLLTLMATGALAGKVVFGRLADGAGERVAYAVAIAIEMVSLVGLLMLPRGWGLEGVTLLLGLGIGGNLPLSAALLARAFGPAAFGSMMGMKMLLLTPLVATGTPFAGWIFDTTGSYRWAFAIFLAFVTSSLVALWRVQLDEPEATLEVRVGAA